MFLFFHVGKTLEVTDAKFHWQLNGSHRFHMKRSPPKSSLSQITVIHRFQRNVHHKEFTVVTQYSHSPFLRIKSFFLQVYEGSPSQGANSLTPHGSKFQHQVMTCPKGFIRRVTLARDPGEPSPRPGLFFYSLPTQQQLADRS